MLLGCFFLGTERFLKGANSNQLRYVSESLNAVQRTFTPLLRNIFDSVEEAITHDSIAATLRFGHDGNVMPLTGLLQLANCYNEESRLEEFYKAWSGFKIVPMAASVQLIFFRKPTSNDILVKFMLNEKETSIPQISTLPHTGSSYYW